MALPDNLSVLAMDAVAKYVHGLCSKLTTIPTSKSRREKNKKQKVVCTADIQKVKTTCRHLHNLLAEIPLHLVNDLTNRLLDTLDNWDYEIGKCRKGSLEAEVFEEIVTSVIHPAVTKIESIDKIFECSDIFPDYVFCSGLCVKIIINQIPTLSTLRKLHILHCDMKCYFTPHVTIFPEQLVDFSGRCNNEVLAELVNTCRNLRCLNLFASKHVTDVSIPHLLNVQHLEKLNISETRITSRGLKSLLTGLHEKSKNTQTLKNLSFSCSGLVQLSPCLQNFPDLQISLQLHSNPFRPNFDLTPLLPLKNICELQIETTVFDMNKILQGIGPQLVYLDVEIEHFGPLSSDDDDDDDDVENCDISEILKIGQHCSSLKCLHLTIRYYFFPRMIDYIRPQLPGFQKVQCLAIELEDDDKFEATDYFNFLINQCVNLKKLSLAYDRHIFDVHSFMCNIIQSDLLRNLELVFFRPFCPRCAIVDRNYNRNRFEQAKLIELLQMLIALCPHLRVIGLEQNFTRNFPHNPQRLKVVPTWCRCKNN